MPLFEYTCQQCSVTNEFLQKFSDPAPEQCPACGATQSMSKEVSLSSFQLKGGGWYKDLYSSTPAKSEKEGTGSEKSTSSSKEGGSKTESSSSSSSSSSKASTGEKKSDSGAKKINKTAA